MDYYDMGSIGSMEPSMKSMNMELPNDNSSIISLVCVCIVCIVCVIFFGVAYYFYSRKNKLASASSSSASSSSAAVAASMSLKTQLSSETIEKKSKDISVPIIPGISLEEDKSLTSTQIDCTIKLKDNLPIYTCTHPNSFKIIKLVNGPILKISASDEIDLFKVKTSDYYIIVPFVFIVDFLMSISLKEIEFKSLQDFMKEIDRIDETYNNTNTIPDKCLKVPLKIRTESKAPYNSTCIFFPGFSSIGALISTLQKTIVNEIPINILTEYYNTVDKKLENKEPELTIFEYVMYVASMNRVKSTKYRYYAICESDQSITC